MISFTFHVSKNKIFTNLREQINIEYEKPLHERNATDCKIPNIVFLMSSLDGFFPLIKSATYKKKNGKI